MRFRKLFKILVLGGAVVGAGATAGCKARADEPEKKDKADAGTSDAGTKKPADEGGGVQGW